MFERNFFREIYITNIEKCTDLFGSDDRRSRESIFVEYFKFVSEVLKVYRPDIFNGDFKPSKGEQQDVKEMLEAIIDTIHYARFKRGKNE